MVDISAEALEFLRDEFRDKVGPSIETIPYMHGKLLVTDKDGGHQIIDQIQEPADFHCLDLPDFVRAVSTEIESGDSYEVWVSESRARLVRPTGDGTREDLPIYLSFRAALPFQRLVASGGPHRSPMNAAGLGEYLRYQVGEDFLGENAGMVQRLMNLDFNAYSATNTRRGFGEDSLGRSVETKAQGIDEIPEFFAYTGPLYSTPWFRQINVKFEMRLKIDPGAQTVQVFEIPGSKWRAIEDGVAKVTNDIEGQIGQLSDKVRVIKAFSQDMMRDAGPF